MAEKERNDDNTGKSEGKQGHGKRILLRTFGCQMNERDSEAVKGLLLEGGFRMTSVMDEADVVLFNTCSVRDHAERRVYGMMGEFRELKNANPQAVVGVLGCVAQAQGKKLLKRFPEVDFVCGPGNLNELPAIIEKVRLARAPVAATDRVDEGYGLDGIGHRESKIKALVTIMTGCDNRCTYCVVPSVRGHERSRPLGNILAEIRDLAERGFKDVTLLGQNVDSYGKGLKEKIDFVGLLEKISEVAGGIRRLRFMTSHPKDAHERLFMAMKHNPLLCHHLHLPVQSGSDRVLKRMKRQHTARWYLEQVDLYRRLVPDGSITTDLIVGFPGESGKDFEETLEMVRRVRFDSAFIFKYSVRPGTPAAKLKDDVPESEKEKRHAALLSAQRQVSAQISEAMIGRTVEVLFEYAARKHKGQAIGRTGPNRRVAVFSKEALIGRFLDVKITGFESETLLGELIT